MRTHTRVLTVVAATAALAIGMTVPASATTTLDSIGPGAIMAKGMVVLVPVTGTCAYNGRYAVVMNLTETKGKKVIYGAGGTNWAPCDSESFSTTVSVQTVTYPLVFKNGTAIAEATVMTDDAGIWDAYGLTVPISLK